MKEQKGVTLTTLTIYIIVATILLGTLAFININFMSELGALTRKSQATNEMTKFYSFIIDDLKSSNKILEFSENYLRFDNGVQYSVVYRKDDNIGAKDGFDIYEIYRGNTLITDKLSGVFFDYDYENEFVKIRLYYKDDDVIKNDEQYFKVGRGY